jgi:hypothetical protein
VRTDSRPYNTPVSPSMGAGMDAAAQGHRGGHGVIGDVWSAHTSAYKTPVGNRLWRIAPLKRGFGSVIARFCDVTAERILLTLG